MGNYTLIFNTLTKKGNIAIIQEGIIIDIESFGAEDSKTESVLNKISALLLKNGIDRRSIKRILYTDDGEMGKSRTKNRVFQAILQGLKNSLHLQVQMISDTKVISVLCNESNMKSGSRLLCASDNVK